MPKLVRHIQNVGHSDDILTWPGLYTRGKKFSVRRLKTGVTINGALSLEYVLI